MYAHVHSKGKLEVICGPMFSGKSEELIRRMRRAKIAKQRVAVFKPSIDNRYSLEHVTSHDGSKIAAYPIENISSIVERVQQDNITVVGIDEVQFCADAIIPTICTLVNAGKRVIVAGLNLDFRGVPFGPMPTLLAIADSITKLHAICTHCGNEAHFTQRMVNNKPANYDDPIILIGAQEAYDARCRDCYSIDKLPPFSQTTSACHGC